MTQDVAAAYLYSPTSGDEALNVKFFHNFARDVFAGEMDTPAQMPRFRRKTILVILLPPFCWHMELMIELYLIPGAKRLLSSSEADGIDKKCLFYPGED
ncbi:MAG: hypothetical protein U0Z26_04780 [Anaerolineales bacterium]